MICNLCRKLAGYDQWSGMVVHVAMDSTVIVDDIREFNDTWLRNCLKTAELAILFVD